ncbi:MAG: FAD-dependent oxidoreductase, partial [Rhodobacterales bacterium]
MSLIGQTVTVIGAGVAGLAVARALALRGAKVTVLEQADAIREVGAGLQISPNGAAVLRALGLQGALETASTRAEAVQLVDGPTGEPVTRLDLARLRPGQGYHFLHRADLIALLLQGATEAGVTLRNIVAVEERAKWAEESWTLRDDPMDLRLAFEGFAPRVQGWLERVEDPWLWGLFRHPVAATWTRTLPQGAVAILGDAAHPTLPFLAQGASMALEDAWVLAESLASHDTAAAALAAYQAARKP